MYTYVILSKLYYLEQDIFVSNEYIMELETIDILLDIMRR